MRFKVRSRQAEEVAMGGFASMLTFIPVPIVIGVAIATGPVRWDYGAAGVVTLVLLLITNARDVLAVRRNDLAHFTPLAALMQLLLAVLAIAFMLLAIQGRSFGFIAMFLLPLVSAAVIGDRSFMAVMWMATLGALVASLMLGGAPGDLTVRAVMVAGSIWGSVMLVIDYSLREAALHQGTSDGLAELASASNALHEWPGDLTSVADLVLRATGVDRFWLFSSVGGADPEELLRWGAAPDVAQEGHVRALARASLAARADRFTAPGYVRVRRGSAELALTLLVPDRTPRRTPTEPERIEAVTSVLLLMAQRAQQLEGLLTQAMTDPLTGLPNRRQLYEEMERQISVSGRSGRPVAVAMLDLDHFKDINDRFGHHEGDNTLCEVGSLLDSNTRRMDLVARYGGEEFALVFPGLASADAAQVMLELQATLRAARAERGVPPVTFSAGVAEWMVGEELEHLLGRADEALYRAKAAGRDLVMEDGSDEPAG